MKRMRERIHEKSGGVKNKMAYVFLALAIVFELIATTLLKYSEGFRRPAPTIACIVLYIVCYFFLARALNDINLGVAYAAWSGVGIVVTALISYFLFKQQLSLVTVLGMVLVIAGCIMINLTSAAH